MNVSLRNIQKSEQPDKVKTGACRNKPRFLRTEKGYFAEMPSDAIGSVTIKLLPCKGWLFTVMVP